VQLARIENGVRVTRSALIVARMQGGQITARVIDDESGRTATAGGTTVWYAIAAAMIALEERWNAK
jgi:hypothetical protein